MVSVELDITFVIQLVNFLIALLVLNFLIIKPIRKVIKQRQEMVGSLVDEAGSFRQEAESSLARYEAALDEAKGKALAVKETLRRDGAAAERERLTAAQRAAQDFLQNSRRELEQELAAAKTQLEAQVGALAGKVVNRVLG